MCLYLMRDRFGHVAYPAPFSRRRGLASELGVGVKMDIIYGNSSHICSVFSEVLFMRFSAFYFGLLVEILSPLTL